MIITTEEKPAVIELGHTNTLVAASTYEMTKYTFTASNYKSIKLKVYSEFFVVIIEDKNGAKSQKVFSDTWDFLVK